MQSVIIGPNQAGQRLDKFLRKYLPLAGNGFLYRMLRRKNILLNGRKAEGREILSIGDEVKVFFSDETFVTFSGRELPKADIKSAPEPEPWTALKANIDTEPEAAMETAPKGPRRTDQKGHRQEAKSEYKAAYAGLSGIGILYENEDLLILNKPCGVLTQKAAAADLSLNEWMIGYLLDRDPGLVRDLPTFRPSVCNRLDRNTSGIVLCGKSLAGSQYLSRCIRERTIRKFYRTICAGALRAEASIEGWLVKNEAKNRVTISKEPASGASWEGASPIHTVYSPIAVTEDYTLLEVELITGKPHQIRAHLASVGHPLIGDYKYGSKSVNDILKKKYGLEHQLLHACRAQFPEAESGPGKPLSHKSIYAPEPDLFLALESGLFKNANHAGKT